MDDLPHPGRGVDPSSENSEGHGGEARLGELRAAIELGLEEIRMGRVVDPEQALGRIEAMLDELEAAKRS